MRRYTDEQKAAALYLVREVGVTEASRRLAISKHTLTDWKACMRACAYSPYVGRGRTPSEGERKLLLAQLVHEQELELRMVGSSRRAQHERRTAHRLLDEPLDEVLRWSGTVHRYLLEWLDPTFDEVAGRLAS